MFNDIDSPLMRFRDPRKFCVFLRLVYGRFFFHFHFYYSNTILIDTYTKYTDGENCDNWILEGMLTSGIHLDIASLS